MDHKSSCHLLVLVSVAKETFVHRPTLIVAGKVSVLGRENLWGCGSHVTCISALLSRRCPCFHGDHTHLVVHGTADAHLVEVGDDGGHVSLQRSWVELPREDTHTSS